MECFLKELIHTLKIKAVLERKKSLSPFQMGVPNKLATESMFVASLSLVKLTSLIRW